MKNLTNNMGVGNKKVVIHHLAIIIEFMEQLKELNKGSELNGREFVATYIDIKRYLYKCSNQLILMEINKVPFYNLFKIIDKICNKILDKDCKEKDINKVIEKVKDFKNELE